jgi:hypothetical protein
MGAARARPVVVPVAVSLHLLLALGFAALRVAGTAPPLRALEWPGELVMALAYALPALLGLLALAGRQAALLAASVLSVPLAFTALSGISLVLLVPAALDAVGYARWRPRPPLRLPALGLLSAIVVLGAAALPVLLASAGDDTAYCWAATIDPDGHRTYGRLVERRPTSPSGQHSIGLAEGGPQGTASEAGCSTGIIELPQAGKALAVTAAALAAGLLLPSRPAPPPAPRRSA